MKQDVLRSCGSLTAGAMMGQCRSCVLKIQTVESSLRRHHGETERLARQRRLFQPTPQHQMQLDRTGSDFRLKEQPDRLSLFHCFASFLIDPKQETSHSFYRVTRVVAHRGGTLQEAERKTASGAEKRKKKKERKLNRKKFLVCQ